MVTDGIVQLSGQIEHKSMVSLAVQMAQAIDGVVEARCELVYAVDDSRLPLAEADT